MIIKENVFYVNMNWKLKNHIWCQIQNKDLSYLLYICLIKRISVLILSCSSLIPSLHEILQTSLKKNYWTYFCVKSQLRFFDHFYYYFDIRFDNSVFQIYKNVFDTYMLIRIESSITFFIISSFHYINNSSLN